MNYITQKVVEGLIILFMIASISFGVAIALGFSVFGITGHP